MGYLFGNRRRSGGFNGVQFRGNSLSCFHGKGLGYFSDKSLNSDKLSCGWLRLSNCFHSIRYLG